MCFSAPVSFIASTALAITGAITLKKTKTKKEIFLASVPVIFAFQQFIEGLLWLYLLHGEPGPERYWLTQIFVAIAGVIWPMLIPLSLFMIEPNKARGLWMLLVFAVGAGIAIYTVAMMTISGASARIVNSCILYEHPIEQTKTILAFYILAACGAFFLSSHRMILWIGAVNLAGLLLSYRLYFINFVSVWCFFAAIASGLIYAYFNHFHFRLRLRKNQKYFSPIYTWLGIP